METATIRLPKNKLYEDSLHSEPFLNWIQLQVEKISKFAEVINEIQEDQVRRIISPMRVNECAAKFVEFYLKNIAFIKIYEEFKEEWSVKAEKLHDDIYLDIKRQVTDYTSIIGSKYKKKDATQSEIEKEMKSHEKYSEYLELFNKSEEYRKKAETQSDFVKGLGKLDSILNLLQKASYTEMKFLYLES